MTLIVEAKNIQKKYGDFEAVKDVSFAVNSGTCVGLLGPNGAGKSSTMRIMIGLSGKTSGEMTIFGKDVSELTRAEKLRMGLVPQEDNLDPDLTVRENLEVYGTYFGIPWSKIHPQVDKLLEFMKLTEKADARVNHLSGGMKRRLTIARALINDPELVILDEPTTGLDPQARVMIWKALLSLKEEGKSLLLTTHYMDEAQRLCDNIVIVDHGEVLDEGSPKELIQKHVKNYVFDLPKPVAENLLEVDHEDVGDSVLFYVNDPAVFKARLADDIEYTQRQANLEDVFLRLTGHKLRS